MTLAELASRLDARLEGDGSIQVFRVAALDEAGPGDLTFVTNVKYVARLASTRASAAIVDDSITRAPCALLRSSLPYVAVANAVGLLTPPPRPAPGISALAAIDPTAEIGPEVSIGSFVTIGARARIGARTILAPHVVVGDDATIGPDCLIHAHVSIRESVEVGARVVIQDAAVVGSDGFGFARHEDGTHQKIPQVGRVVVEDDVEIGAQTAIDRPAIGETRIGRGSKIDNLVQIAHGVTLGRNVLLVAQAGIAGSTSLGDDVVMGGQAGAAGHLKIGRGVVISARSVVTKDIEDGRHIAGMPAEDVSRWRDEVALVRRLPELRQRLVDLEARLAAIEARKMT